MFGMILGVLMAVNPPPTGKGYTRPVQAAKPKIGDTLPGGWVVVKRKETNFGLVRIDQRQVMGCRGPFCRPTIQTRVICEAGPGVGDYSRR